MIIQLVFDKSKRDKYGRQLAYVYSKSARNLGLLQLRAGFAKQWVVGANERFWRCFQDAEREARQRRRGIWSGFKPLRAAKITDKDKGYQYIRGIISETTENKKGLQFFLDRRLKVRISASKLKKFKDNNTIEVIHIEEAKEFIAKNYNKDLNMAVVSNHVSLNYTYFSGLFKKYMNVN